LCRAGGYFGGAGFTCWDAADAPVGYGDFGEEYSGLIDGDLQDLGDEG
jgi:hypothetical protein